MLRMLLSVFVLQSSVANSDPDTATSFNRSDDNTEANVDISSTAHSGYKGINWNRLPGYLASKQRRRQRAGWVWEHGYDIEKDSSGYRFWLCKECHQTKAAITHISYTATVGRYCVEFLFLFFSTAEANPDPANHHRSEKSSALRQ
ncbi:Uncharacterized protein HZ326_31209 [Fusarium oxysporum f. sp. albedinis]|nr:Uncharacterized protein HZ326_31209 [Fusarium oxysporum f. sp. albedinis]